MSKTKTPDFSPPAGVKKQTKRNVVIKMDEDKKEKVARQLDKDGLTWHDLFHDMCDQYLSKRGAK